MKRLPPQELCAHCGMPGNSVLLGEQIAVYLDRDSVWRHPACGHVQWYRGGGVYPAPPHVLVSLVETAPRDN